MIMNARQKRHEKATYIVIQILMGLALIFFGLLQNSKNPQSGYGLTLLTVPGITLLLTGILWVRRWPNQYLCGLISGLFTLVLLAVALTIKQQWTGLSYLWPILLAEPLLIGLMGILFAMLHN